ncbi:MAG: Ig-like domain-containing protein [Candidatus Borkfalkiaceae bacterium]|nr:Ig-like domain-containing protein [Christensenellaceae bacterium]
MKKIIRTLILCLCLCLAASVFACGKGGGSSSGSSSGGSSGSSGSAEIVFYLVEKAEVKEYTNLELSYSLTGFSVADVVWKSENTQIATVSAGIVTGVKEGVTKITATAGDIVRECEVTVTKNSSYPVLVLSQEDCMPRVGGSVLIKASVRFNGEIQDFSDFSWKSLNEDIATVSAGEVFGVAKGETAVVVSATFNGVYLEETVRVVITAE